MTATKPLGTYGNAAGTVTPLDHKMAQSGLVAKTTTANVVRAGLFYNGTSTIVSGTANMSYNVAAFSAAHSRGATAGTTLLTNDATYNVATTAAPGSNSRYDVVYVWAREYSIDGTDSNPVIGVVQGTAAASPTVPSLSAYPGAIELARILVPAGVTATNSGTTFTQTAPFTSVDGGSVAFRTTTEMNLWTTALNGQRARDLANAVDYKYDGTAWRAFDTSWQDASSLLTWTNLTIGNGTIEARMFRMGRRMKMKTQITMGSTTSGTGQITMTLNSAIQAASTYATAGRQTYFGRGLLLDIGTSQTEFVLCTVASQTAVQFLTTSGGAAGRNTPATLTASGDQITFEIEYELA